MPRVRVSTLKELPPGSVVEVIADSGAYAVCNADGKLHCITGICPHAGAPLGQRTLHGEMLVCPWHAWEFNCRTGVNDIDDELVLDTYPVSVENGSVFVDLP